MANSAQPTDLHIDSITRSGFRPTVARILLVEDDEDLALTVSDSLTSEKHTVQIVHDGLDAQELLRVEGYDVIVLDWSLPGMSGVDLLRRYRANGGEAFVIMLTGRDTVENTEIGLDAGADDYLTKPFDLRELAVRVKTLLRRPTTRFTNTLNEPKF
jgi:DNA-binding response OmpR family regulator